MALDVPVPDRPDLSNRGVPSEFEEIREVGPEADLRREELESVLREGAWQEAFDEWASYTDLSESEFDTAREYGLFRQFDFFWDSRERRLRFDPPRIPDDIDDSTRPGSMTQETRTTINTALEEFGRTVLEVLVSAYLDWGEEPSDYVWDEETFGQGTRRED